MSARDDHPAQEAAEREREQQLERRGGRGELVVDRALELLLQDRRRVVGEGVHRPGHQDQPGHDEDDVVDAVQLVDARAERGAEDRDVEERLEQRRAERLALDLHEARDLAPDEREEADLRRRHGTSPAMCARESSMRPTSSRYASSRRRDAVAVRQLAARPLGDDLAVVDERDPVAQLLGLFEVVRRQQDRRAPRVDPLDVVPQLEPQLDVDAGGRLVEDQQPRAVHQRPREDQPALHAARERPRAVVALGGERERVEQLGGALLALAPRHPEVAAVVVERLLER